MLELVDLTKKMSKDDYHRRLPPLRRRLLELQQAAWRARIPSLVIFEGWDASGKGDCIRKLTERLEPRGFDLHYIPDKARTYALDLPWMWRFWQLLPGYGKMAIFDRSWNRRAILRKLDGADELEWRRRLRDISDFERMLSDDGYVFIKFFFHISEKVQQKRYEDWLEEPGLSWKALEKDWKKPTRYDEHLAAAEELLQNTESARAPWNLVPATDPRFVRTTVFETLIARLEEALTERGAALPETSLDGVDESDDDDGDDNGDDGDDNGDGDGNGADDLGGEI